MKWIFFVCSFWTLNVFAQNLLDNGDFEQYSSLPNNVMQSNRCVGWSTCSQGGGGSPDYFHLNGTGLVQLPNSFYATISPHGGSAIMGLITYHGLSTNFREYIAHSLSSPLIVGQTYQIQLFLSNGQYNGNYGGCGSNHFGVAFTTNEWQQIGSSPMEFISPQFIDNNVFYHTDWQEINFSFVADSAYQHIILGNFTSNANTSIQNVENSPNDIAYVFIDDISVARISGETLVTEFDEAQHEVWFDPGLRILHFEPTSKEPAELEIWNLQGSLMTKKTMSFQDSLDVNCYPEGIYFYRINRRNENPRTKMFRIL